VQIAAAEDSESAAGGPSAAEGSESAAGSPSADVVGGHTAADVGQTAAAGSEMSRQQLLLLGCQGVLFRVGVPGGGGGAAAAAAIGVPGAGAVAGIGN
jgi:hypothetical protein